MNKTYRGQAAIYAGMQAPAPLPGWARAARLHEWVQVPGNTLASINPENNPAINPNHPAASPWRGNTGHPALFSYGGAAYDDSTGEFLLPLQGGHQDYGGNEPYKIQMFSENPQWQMIRPPSGAVGNVINLKDGKETTGLYSDGRLRSVHSYGYSVAANGKMYAGALVGQYPLGQSLKAWCVEIDKITGEHRLVCDFTGTNIGSGYAACAIDPVRNKLFTMGRETARFVEIDLTSGAFVNIGSMENVFGGYAYVTASYAPAQDRLLFVSSQTAATGYKAHRGIAVLNPATRTVAYPACDNYPAFLSNAIGAAWQSTQNRLLLWDNATETNKVAVLTPSNTSDLTQPWSVSVITGTGVTPTAREGSGTYNRFQYSKRLGGVLLINATNQNFFFMRTD